MLGLLCHRVTQNLPPLFAFGVHSVSLLCISTLYLSTLLNYRDRKKKTECPPAVENSPSPAEEVRIYTHHPYPLSVLTNTRRETLQSRRAAPRQGREPR